jgi:TPR repeat protein
MLNKLVVIFSFVLLAISSTYAASLEQSNSVLSDTNSIQSIINNAERGDQNAQIVLFQKYLMGQDIQQDNQEALKWLTKAAEDNNGLAQVMLGEVCRNNKYCEEAIKWFTKASEHKNDSSTSATSQGMLGEMYYFGECVQKDYKEAFKWYIKSAEQGNPLAQQKIGLIYSFGDGVQQDYKEASRWYAKAAEQGYAKAQYSLGVQYDKGQGVPQDYKKALNWYTKAAEQGYADAQIKVGVMYFYGRSVSQNYNEAIKWYKRAAFQGSALAQFILGEMYYEGKGVIEDFVEAYKWTLLASMNGQDVSELKRALTGKMTYAQIAEAQRRAKEFVAQKENVTDSGISDLEDKVSPKISGTGFFVSPSGYMITAAHVVKNARSIQILASSGKYQAKVLLLDEPTDIAVLKIDGAEIPYLEVVSSSIVNVGDKIFTVGFPNVSVQGTEPKYTDGTISSLSGIDNNIHHFQISIPVQPGNSGGPLLSSNGEVVGVVISRLNDIGMLEATGTLPQNVNYAVKSAFILPLLENIPGWQPPKAKPIDMKMSDTEVINKARNAVALIIVY